jgi:hypothetical protein
MESTYKKVEALKNFMFINFSAPKVCFFSKTNFEDSFSPSFDLAPVGSVDLEVGLAK